MGVKTRLQVSVGGKVLGAASRWHDKKIVDND